jgi:hypothetical protein
MSGFLTCLAERTLGLVPVLEAPPRSRFEPSGGAMPGPGAGETSGPGHASPEASAGSEFPPASEISAGEEVWGASNITGASDIAGGPLAEAWHGQREPARRRVRPAPGAGAAASATTPLATSTLATTASAAPHPQPETAPSSPLQGAGSLMGAGSLTAPGPLMDPSSLGSLMDPGSAAEAVRVRPSEAGPPLVARRERGGTGTASHLPVDPPGPPGPPGSAPMGTDITDPGPIHSVYRLEEPVGHLGPQMGRDETRSEPVTGSGIPAAPVSVPGTSQPPAHPLVRPPVPATAQRPGPAVWTRVAAARETLGPATPSGRAAGPHPLTDPGGTSEEPSVATTPGTTTPGTTRPGTMTPRPRPSVPAADLHEIRPPGTPIPGSGDHLSSPGAAGPMFSSTGPSSRTAVRGLLPPPGQVEAGPRVVVNIGRVEVRVRDQAVPSKASREARGTPAERGTRPMSLDDYLSRREEKGR